MPETPSPAVNSAIQAVTEAFKTARDFARHGGNATAGGDLPPFESADWSNIEMLAEAAGLDTKELSEMKELDHETMQAIAGSDGLIIQLSTELIAATTSLIAAHSVVFPPVLPCVVMVYGPPISPFYGGGGVTTFIPTLEMMNSAIALTWNVTGYGAAFPNVSTPALPGCTMNLSIKAGR